MTSPSQRKRAPRHKIGKPNLSRLTMILYFIDCMPRLPELLRFPLSDGKKVNLAVEIGSKSSVFGTMILEDDRGKKVESIGSHFDVVEKNQNIFTKWLEGAGKKPLTWATFIDALKDSELPKLAEQIQGT